MKKIKLTQNKYALVDDEDYEYLNQFKWYYNGRYAARREPGVNNKMQLMHRVILKPGDNLTDHINGNGIDNRKCNLRIATHSENIRNTQKQKGCTSKYKGVYWNKTDKIWRAKIFFNKKRIHLGSYDKEIDAAKAYNNKAKELYGQFARLNIIKDE